ncbi:MAG: endopeptidase La [Clostridia bacterium]
MPDNKGKPSSEKMPLVPLRGLLAYPNMMLKLDVGRDKSITAVEHALEGDQRVLLVAQRDATVDDPHLEDVYGVGTVAVIKQVVRLPDDTVRLLVEGESRARLLGVVEEDDMQVGELTRIQAKVEDKTHELTAQARFIKKLFNRLASDQGGFSSELRQAIDGEESLGTLADLIAANALTGIKDKQVVLEAHSIPKRLQALMGILAREIELLQIEKRIQSRIHDQIDQNQKTYYLNEQMSAIREELGEDDEAERVQFERKLTQSKMNADARDQVTRELGRLSHMQQGTPEATVSRNYIECMLDLPWGIETRDNRDILKARKVLDRDHFGLEKPKERILEFLAVSALKGDLRGPILCLVGPPGVGKTSIAQSIAKALGRKFVRMSLGGLRDEAEIRGHRRTYIGAIPGRIVSSIRKCGTVNPVFLLDEIDKMASDHRGDPASALLEALDPEQNATFADHYLDAPFDLSKVLFLTTANSSDEIPQPLLDRMDLIEVSGYTPQEKTQIALKHLWIKQLKAHGLTKAQVKLAPNALMAIVEEYTRESGVRTLERRLAQICRKAAMRLSEGTPSPLRVNEANLCDFLGIARYTRPEATSTQPTCGVVNGLAWTTYGGETLQIEVAIMPGKGIMDLTGQLGDVMKESARAAHSYIRAHAETLHIAPDFFEKHDLHIHVPEGATPKDGPSAGVALTCAMVSAITGRLARQNVAMTGEITLLGHVLPIGGVKEKLLAAHRMGMTLVLLPKGNEKDLEEIPGDVRKALEIHLLEQVDQAFDYVLEAV